MINSTISPTTQKIATSTNVSSAGINGNHALLVAKSQFTITPTTSTAGRIHQSVSFRSRVMVIATGASSHVMAYYAMMNSRTNPNKTQKKTPNPVPHAAGTSSILYFLPYPPNKFAPGQNVLPCARSVVFGMRNFIAGRDNGSTSLRSCPAHS